MKSKLLLSLYHTLPYPLKVFMASLEGIRLQNWRYGPETEALVADAHEREHWNARQWTDYQGQQVARLLDHAASSVPYYRDLWSHRRRT
ncbi:MAG: hypothetical protein ACOX9A_02635 [Anaerolineae bacterium]|jgi:hypothetical protein